MDLKPGDTLGPYQILSPLGKGGMGEVWKANDPRLDRIVAIKTSSARFSDRFEREARAVAALNHPNICHLYDVGPNYLVMEYVEGVSPTGPYPADRALHIASQLAAALDAAHAKGIVHRDLKPGNIIVTADGTVKVLDFGLAKMMQADVIGVDDGTLSLSLTQAGVVMGTAGYMAPEQAEGKPVDKRADIWAFGVILFELLASQRLFRGTSVQDTLAQVLSREVDLTRVPAEYRLLLRRCLDRNPASRLRDIGDAVPLVGQVSPEDAVQGRPASSRWWRWATAVFALASLTLGVFHFREGQPVPPVPIRFRIPYPEGVKPSESGLFSLSPDGRTIAFSAAGAAGGKVWIQALDSLEPRILLPETKTAETLPYWSGDSKSLLYVSEGRLKKADLAGGGAQTLCEAPGTVLGVSSSGDQILFGSLSSPGIMKVAASGGKPVPVTERNGDRHIFPFFLPDGKHFLYLRLSATLENTGIYAGSLAAASGEQPARRLIATTTAAEFVPGQDHAGRILFLRDGNLMAQDFDTASLQIQGEPIPVVRSVGNTRAYPFFASASGNLVYRNAPAQTNRMTWFDRSGRQILEEGDPLPASDGPVLNPSGTRAVISQWDPADRLNDLWLYSLSPWGSLRLIRGPSLNEYPVWSTDGRYIAYASRRSDHMDIYKANANGDGQQVALLESPVSKFPQSWSRSGYLLYSQRAADTGNDLWVLPPGGKPFPFLASPANETAGSFSPDGNRVAYLSDESGTVDLYIRSFTTTADSTAPAVVGPRIPISTGGADAPHWRADGRELYYIARNGNLMAVPVSPGADLQIGQAVALFPAPLPDHWDVAPDGQRFLFTIPIGQKDVTPFTVVLNWQAELKK